jgi:hypothetical protein
VVVDEVIVQTDAVAKRVWPTEAYSEVGPDDATVNPV